MDHFRKITRGQTVVMGQKTFESIGKPLMNRTNIVLTDDTNFKANGVTIYTDVNRLINDFKQQHIFIIGGKSIYELFNQYADEIIVSKIKKNYHCNRFMYIDFSHFDLIKTEPYEEFNVEYYKRKYGTK
jgi:dihydrofolate reductase